MASKLPPLDSCTIAVIGLGYVGLPLAVEFANTKYCCRSGIHLKRRVVGFDINEQRLSELKSGIDLTRECSQEELASAALLEYTNDPLMLLDSDVFIITVPTPIDSSKRPDLSPLKSASKTVGRALKERNQLVASTSKAAPIIVYESTVYPGATEEVCLPIIEAESGLKFNDQFFCGYSPERINPGDKEHRLTDIVKVTSGSTPEVSSWIDNFYGSIIKAGTFKAKSLKVAEAAKVIENTQRDLNIALVNELAIIFRRMNIDTLDVIDAAASKWNFLPFSPGLVGGHCIGVDPYYLTYKAEQLGYYPQVVLAGRRINDGMGRWVVEQLVLEMASHGHIIAGSNVLILGLTFKENCPDIRNTRIVDIVTGLKLYGMNPILVDPCVDTYEAQRQFDFTVYSSIPTDQTFPAVIAAVKHREFVDLPHKSWQDLLCNNGILIDLKGIIPRALNPLRL